MADDPLRRSGGDARHLDAFTGRNVVYCHQCDHQWYQEEHGLTCPRCDGEITEIVTRDSDPRPLDEASLPDLADLHNHHPWQDSDASDPEEADIEEHITRGPGGSVFISQTFRSSTTRGASRHRQRNSGSSPNDPEDVMRDFQNMISTLMGPNFRPGPLGRSGADTLFPPDPFGGLRYGGGAHGPGRGPEVIGGRFTYTTRLRPRNTDGPQPEGLPVDQLATYAPPLTSFVPSGRPMHIISITGRPDQLASLIGNIFGQRDPTGPQDGHPGLPPALQGLFASLLRPDTAIHGDAVYTQEALDRIMTNLMEQHPTSNAPGPAPPDAIAALPKKTLDFEMLGPEGKGECSVCMDDVHVGDEVVHLPCSHWFHEACASAWLGEHNTCPICRKGIGADTSTSSSRTVNQAEHPSRNEHRPHRSSMPRTHLGRDNTISRNEARLNLIRNGGRLTPSEETESPLRWQFLGDNSHVPHSGRPDLDYASHAPGGRPGSYRRRNSEMSDNQRDSRRVNTGGSDRSRRSSQGGSGGGSNGNGQSNSQNNGSGSGSGSGPIAWIRDRFSGSNGRRNE